MEAKAIKELANLREELDKLDDEIASLILKRLEKSFLIGKIKKSISADTYTPEREKEILSRILSSVENDDMIIHLQRIFERIIDESRAIQHKLK